MEGRLQEAGHSATCVSAIVLEARELEGLAGWRAGFRNFPPVLDDENLTLGTDGKWKWYVGKHIKHTIEPKAATTKVKAVGQKAAADRKCWRKPGTLLDGPCVDASNFPPSTRG